MVSLLDVKKLLDPDEPDYTLIPSLGPDALEHLETLASSGDEMLASKATYAASLLDDDHGADLVESAAQSDNEVVRVAAAAGIRNLSADRSAALATDLMSSADEGVQRIVLQSAAAHRDAAVAAAVADLTDAASAVPDQPMEGLDGGAEEMPGDESAAGEGEGLMPGETAASSAPGESGLMPGETPPDD